MKVISIIAIVLCLVGLFSLVIVAQDRKRYIRWLAGLFVTIGVSLVIGYYIPIILPVIRVWLGMNP